MLRSKSGIIIALALALASTAPAMAQMSGDAWFEKWQQLDGGAAATPSRTVNVPVRVVEADVGGHTLTISHRAVEKIGMQAMTMSLPVSDTTHLNMLKKGDEVTIHVAKQGGVVTITGFTMKH